MTYLGKSRLNCCVLYDATNDLRDKMYYGSPDGCIDGTYGSEIGHNTSIWWSDHGIRMAEAYLNRAEALTRRFMSDGRMLDDRVQALNDLNALRETRYVAGYLCRRTDY